MSRSAQQGFTEWITKMREEHGVPEQKVVVPILKKYSAVHFISDEQLFTLLALDKPEYERKATKTVVASTTEDWAKYHLAKRALLTLREYENTTGTEEVEIPCPKPKTVYTFLETIEEWLARCRTLRTEQAA